MNNNNDLKVEKKQTTSKMETKKRKATSNDLKYKEPKIENQPKEPIKNFEKVLITEKDNFNQSQRNFMNKKKIKIGDR